MICHPERSKAESKDPANYLWVLPRDSSTALGMTTSQFLGDLLELIALNHIAYLIFAEVTQPDTAFQTRPNFFHVILETPQRRNATVVNRLAPAKNASSPCACDGAVSHEAASYDPSAQLEDLFHF